MGDKNFDSEYVTVFSATNAEEEACAEDEFGHGVWSHYLFFSVKRYKNALIDDKLTNDSLQEYLLLMVREYYEKKYNKCTQTPYMWGKMSKTVIIKDNFDFKLNNECKIADIYFGIVDADNEYKKDKQAFIDNYYDLNEATKKTPVYNF